MKVFRIHTYHITYIYIYNYIYVIYVYIYESIKHKCVSVSLFPNFLETFFVAVGLGIPLSGFLVILTYAERDQHIA